MGCWAMPGRTQSVCAATSGWRSRAALLQAVRGPGRSAVTEQKVCQASFSPGSWMSAVAKCVISPTSATCGRACSRAHTARVRWGEKPSRFMPVLIFRNTVWGCRVLWLASMSICSSVCTVCHRPRREHSSRSRAEKTPSSSRIGPRQPRSRTRCASSRSSSANPSAARRTG